MKYKIIVSYSTKDSSVTDPIVDIIKYYYRVTCWYQRDDSRGDYIEEYNNAIKESGALLLFLSANSIRSLRVKNEISRAYRENSKRPDFQILPVCIEALDENDMDMASNLVGGINTLFTHKYPDNYSLTLDIFKQLKIKAHEEDVHAASIYTGDEEVERRRIFAQNVYLNRIADPYLDDIFSRYASPAVLDVGCADGSNILLRLTGRDYRSLLGIDRNGNKISEAVRRNEEMKNSFLTCNIESPELGRVLKTYLQENGLNGFDIVHIAAVLMHLADASRVLKEIYNYMNDGATIFIQDEDDAFNVTFPKNKFLDDALDIWEHSIESGDRKMGRKIPTLLRESGFTDVRLLSTTVSSLDFNGENKEQLWDMYYNSDLWVVDSASFFDSRLAYEKFLRYKEHHAELKAKYMQGDIFATLGVLFLSAKKKANDNASAHV